MCPETKRIPGILETPYPVLAGDQGKNQYTPMAPTKVDGDMKMEGPVYQGVDSANLYCPTNERVQAPTDMAGPVYQNVVTSNQYNVVNPRVKGPVGVQGPVYLEEGGNHYSEVPIRNVEG